MFAKGRKFIYYPIFARMTSFNLELWTWPFSTLEGYLIIMLGLIVTSKESSNLHLNFYLFNLKSSPITHNLFLKKNTLLKLLPGKLIFRTSTTNILIFFQLAAMPEPQAPPPLLNLTQRNKILYHLSWTPQGFYN